jgi:hypothetical protein
MWERIKWNGWWPGHAQLDTRGAWSTKQAWHVQALRVVHARYYSCFPLQRTAFTAPLSRRPTENWNRDFTHANHARNCRFNPVLSSRFSLSLNRSQPLDKVVYIHPSVVNPRRVAAAAAACHPAHLRTRSLSINLYAAGKTEAEGATRSTDAVHVCSHGVAVSSSCLTAVQGANEH